MTSPVTSRLRLYRLWRTAALLCGVGAAEFAVLYWQQRNPWFIGAAIPLLAVAAYAARRAMLQRRSL